MLPLILIGSVILMTFWAIIWCALFARKWLLAVWLPPVILSGMGCYLFYELQVNPDTGEGVGRMGLLIIPFIQILLLPCIPIFLFLLPFTLVFIRYRHEIFTRQSLGRVLIIMAIFVVLCLSFIFSKLYPT
jgi:hypothetical protein